MFGLVVGVHTHDLTSDSLSVNIQGTHVEAMTGFRIHNQVAASI
jgi:hypothetical protein